jgi:heterodisulfide reductase subunit A
MTFSPRIGVYICHCGINIAATVDVAAVARYAAQLPGVQVARDYTYMCSAPGQALIKSDIAELDLNRIVVASCSPRMHEPTFRAAITEAGLNAYCLEMANIREQCSWVHPGGLPATAKAMQLVAAAVARSCPPGSTSNSSGAGRPGSGGDWRRHGGHAGGAGPGGGGI